MNNGNLAGLKPNAAGFLEQLLADYQALAELDQAGGYPSLNDFARVPTARLGSGTATSSTYLRGDQSWQSLSSIPIIQLADAACSSNKTLGTLSSLITGCTLDITTTTSNAKAYVVGAFDFNTGTSSAGNVMVGELLVDAATQTGSATFEDNGTTNGRGTVVQTWVVDLPSATTYTFELFGYKTAAGGTHTAQATNTILSVMVIESGTGGIGSAEKSANRVLRAERFR